MAETPFATFFTGDFNEHSQLWWPNGNPFATFFTGDFNEHSQLWWPNGNPFATFFTGDFNEHSQFWWPNGNPFATFFTGDFNEHSQFWWPYGNPFATFFTGDFNEHSQFWWPNGNPFATFFTGDFSAHSQLWWPDGNTTVEGLEIENLFTSLGLSQIISEPTNFEPSKTPSCIDLIITDQPNLILDCGTRASIDSYCHHQIIHSKVNFRMPPRPPCERKICNFNRANAAAIKKNMTSSPWFEHLNINNDPKWQVKT